jgi:hypothetical protein
MYNLDRHGSFWLRVWAQQGRGGATGKTIRWSFPLVTVQLDSGFNWKASNRLIVQRQAHFRLTGRVLPQSGFRSHLLDFNKLTMATGCGRFLVKNPFIDDWLDSWKHVCSSWRGRKWCWSDLISVVLLQLYRAWFYWEVSCLPYL